MNKLFCVLVSAGCCFASSVHRCAAEVVSKDDPNKIMIREWGPVVNGQALSISTEKITYAFGECIDLQITHKNISNTNLYQTATLPIKHLVYKIDVFNPNGKAAQCTSYNEMLRVNSLDRSDIYGFFRCGSEDLCKIDINRLYDFTLSGVYTIKVYRAAGVISGVAQTNQERLVSNSLKIKVE